MKTLQLVVLAAAVLGTVNAQMCDQAQCDAAGDRCQCVSTGMLLQGMPQLVILTSQGILTQANLDAINAVTSNVRNFNQCPLPFTFFVETAGSDINAAKNAYEAHHELALSSSKQNARYTGLSYSQALEEMADARLWLVNDAGVPLDRVQGLRSPDMRGTTPMRQAMFALGLSYDSSETSGMPLNPYTMNFGIVGSTDAQAKHAGLWELTESRRNPDFTDADQLAQHLSSTLRLRYEGNRAPLLLSFSPAWLTAHANHTAGVAAFLSAARSEFPETRFVTATDAIRFTANPQTVANFQLSCSERKVFDNVSWRRIERFDLPTRSTTQGNGLGKDDGSSQSGGSSSGGTPAPSSGSTTKVTSAAVMLSSASFGVIVTSAMAFALVFGV